MSPKYYSLKSGKFVSEHYAKRNPKTTAEWKPKEKDPLLEAAPDMLSYLKHRARFCRDQQAETLVMRANGIEE